MFTYEQIQSLNELELAVYNYVIQNIGQVRTMKIRELADQAHVSTTTVLRFCSKMGCDGYSEFKLRLKILKEKAAIKEVQDDVSGMLDFFTKINTTEFKEIIQSCATMIEKAQRVFFLGIGSSGILGQYGARFFSNIGIYSSHVTDPFYPMPDTEEQSVLIVLSVSGETEMILQQVSQYKQKNFKIISITNSENSTLGKVSDGVVSYYMPIKVMGHHYNVTTQVPVVHIIESLGRSAQQLRFQKERCLSEKKDKNNRN